MSMQLRYRGGFYSLNQTLYDIEIWQEGFSGQVKDIAFCDSPLDIEWAKEDKLEPVQSSNATLQLYSDNDRQFVDLYTIEAGSVRMDIYRSKSLYWSGTLDPELYEEPFAYHSDYGVTLTFADMAVLERLKWERVGFMTLREVLVFILSKTGIRYKSINEHISTKLSRKIFWTLYRSTCPIFSMKMVNRCPAVKYWMKPFALSGFVCSKKMGCYLYVI